MSEQVALFETNFKSKEIIIHQKVYTGLRYDLDYIEIVYRMTTTSLPQQTADSVWKEKVTLLNRHSRAGHHSNPRVSLNCLNWNYNKW